MMTFAESRGLKPAAILAAKHPHGERIRYAGGCRCDLCRAANSAYEMARQKERRAGNWNGCVPAEKAKLHMARLTALGVGRRAIAYASDVAETVLMDVRSGRKTKIRALTERRILAVTPEMALDHALIPAAPTWALVDALLKAGFTKCRIAQGIGQNNGALQLGRTQVTVRNAYLVQKLHGDLIDSEAALTDATPTWYWIKQLRGEGYTDKQLARELGFADGELRIGKSRVSLCLARQVVAMHERLTT